MSQNAKEPDLPKGLIGRRGAGSGKSTRLPSLRGPRDLTLGGVPKKVFTPTIPARRDKPKEETTVQKTPKDNDKSHGRGRGDRGRRGRGRGRDNLVQSHSIFEQGPAQKLLAQRASSSYGADCGGGSSGKIGVKKEKQASAKDLDLLLRDDFLEDVTNEDADMPPVILPLSAKVKPEIKKEEMDTDDSTTTSTPKIEGKEDEKKDITLTKKIEKDSSVDFSSVTCKDIFTKCSKTEDSELIFLQLPDTLPGLPIKPDDETNKEESSKDKSKSEETSKKDDTHLNSLSDFTEGFIGKLQIRKSGKAELILRNVKLDVSVGTPSGFLQEIVSVKTEEESGHMSVLGQVKHRLICTPNFESLLLDSGGVV